MDNTDIGHNGGNHAPASKKKPNDHHIAELKAINTRRGELAGVRWINGDGTTGDAVNEPHHPGVIFDHTGLAFSGGGIRSAAICLGVLQALDANQRLEAVDYLSTVSGGGYIGCSYVALAGKMKRFPFAQKKHAALGAADIKDNDIVGHIRDYSNYLMPRGFGSLLLSIGVLLRGLVVSASLALWPMLLIAALMLFTHLGEDGFSHYYFSTLAKYLGVTNASWVEQILAPFGEFKATAILIIALVAGLFAWALERSFREADNARDYEFVSWQPYAASVGVIAVVVVAVFEFQPRIVRVLLQATGDGKADLASSIVAWAMQQIQHYSTLIAPVAGVITFFASRLGDVAKSRASDPTWSGWMAKIGAKALLFLAAITIPLLLYAAWLTLVVHAVGCGPVAASSCGVNNVGWAWATVYLALGAFLFLITWLLEPNANSLHRLYRDRLSAAFLFEPRQGHPGAATADSNTPAAAAVTHRNRFGEPLDILKLSDIDCIHAPYLLVNTALNIQGSPYVNQRGRNADFFLFSKDYIGSHATGFAPTKEMEKRHASLDLGTAMAISGAAASSNMGAYSIRSLAPTLALLNVRLGYWMDNPYLAPHCIERSSPAPTPATSNAPSLRSNFYLFAEMFSLLDEDSAKVYLTDGGHIENLGLYELLKRRCRFIIVVDAEADPGFSFPAFATLQRFARIDLGVRIEDLAWQRIGERSRAFDKEFANAIGDGGVASATPGCHAAIGRICYPDNAPAGVLLYLKSSLTGDENDLILDYKRNNPTFPHETTGDQFFGETQFEAYRALGFHMMDRVLTGEDRVPGLIRSKPDGSLLDGQSEGDAMNERKEAINSLFTMRTATADILRK